MKSKREALYWKATENKVYTGSTDPRRKSQDVTGYHSFESRAPLSRRETSQGESRHIYATLQANERRASRSERSDHYEKTSEMYVIMYVGAKRQTTKVSREILP